MKRCVALSIVAVLALTLCGWADQAAKPAAKPDIYNPSLDVKAEIAAALIKAKAENKHVLVMFGANWCSWCHKLHELINGNAAIKTFLAKKYIFIMADIGEKKETPLNRDLTELYRVGGSYGVPALAVLNAAGELMCAQSSGVLENGKGHDPDKVLCFLKANAPAVK